MLTYLASDEVVVKDFAPQAVKVSFRDWLRLTDKAAEIVEGAIADGGHEWAQLSNGERRAWQWLAASGLNTAEALDGYKARRALHDQPGDRGALVRCGCCGRVLLDPVSKLLGYGPECRAGKCRCKKNGG
jgi:hypothetical protein